MFFKFKNTKENYEFFCIKLYKKVTLDEAKIYNVLSLIKKLHEIYETKLGGKLDGSGINYGKSKSCKNIETLIKRYSKAKVIVYADPSYKIDGKDYLITFGNNILNKIKPPENDLIDIQMSMPYSKYSLDLVKDVILSLESVFDLSVGYIVLLKKNFDITSERQIKWGKTETNENDIQKYQKLKEGILVTPYPIMFVRENSGFSVPISEEYKSETLSSDIIMYIKN